MQEVERSLKSFYTDTILPLQSLNIDSMASEYNRLKEEANQVKTYKQEHQVIQQVIQDVARLDSEQSEFPSRVISLLMVNYFPNMLQVGIHNSKRIDGILEAWQLFNGLKDGSF